MNLFFNRKPKVTPKDSIVELRNTLQMLEKRETFLQTKIDNELKIAKANATKNRRGTTHLTFLSFCPTNILFSLLTLYLFSSCSYPYWVEGLGMVSSGPYLPFIPYHTRHTIP
jgi:hypothetical protein